jgi:hypothetical protein
MVMKYREYRDLVKKTNNPVGALVMAFKELHDDAPVQDFENLGGRMAGICKYNRNDYGLTMKIVWDSCSCGINGSHLNYIQAMITRQKPYLVKAENNLQADEKKYKLSESDKFQAKERAKTVWVDTLKVLKDKVSAMNYETWLKDTVGLGYDTVTKEFAVGITNISRAEWIENRLHSLIKRSISEVTGKKVEVIYKVIENGNMVRR